MNRVRLRESVSPEKTRWDSGGERGRTATRGEGKVNRRNEEGFVHHQRHNHRHGRNNDDNANRRFHLPAAEQGYGAVVVGTVRIRMKGPVQRLNLSQGEEKQEQAQQPTGYRSPGQAGVADSILSQVLQDRVSSAKTMHTDNRHLCKPLASLEK